MNKNKPICVLAMTMIFASVSLCSDELPDIFIANRAIDVVFNNGLKGSFIIREVKGKWVRMSEFRSQIPLSSWYFTDNFVSVSPMYP